MRILPNAENIAPTPPTLMPPTPPMPPARKKILE